MNQEANRDESNGIQGAGEMTLLAARQLLEAIDERYPGGEEKHAGMFIGDGHLCVAVPWHDGYRIVALHETDYTAPASVIVGALDRFFTAFDARAAEAPKPQIEQ